ncbi:MAG: hypothetical protein MUC50_23075, partial [Myxococcota bacterium]|nr:hypothetical protein [Myxococcota bacterium]
MNVTSGSRRLVEAARQAVRVCLCATDTDSAMVLFDDSTDDIAAAFRTAFEEVGVPVHDVSLDELGPRPLATLPRQLLDRLARCSVSVMAVRAVQGEFTLRRGVLESVATTGRRHAHMPSITPELFADGLSMDYRNVAAFVAKVAQRLRGARRATLMSRAGTDLEIELASPPTVEALDGVILPGTWQNLPSGQVTTEPLATRGVLVVDRSLGDWFQHKYDVAMTPVTVELDGERVRSVGCDDGRLLRDLRLFLGS